MAFIYDVTLPNGKHEVVINLSEFAQKHNLNYHSLHRTCRDNWHYTYKGYSVKKVDTKNILKIVMKNKEYA